MNFILRNGKIRSNAIEHIMGLELSTLHEVVVRPFKDNRSKAQNRLYWKWIPYLADFCGDTNNKMHRELKGKFLGFDVDVIAGEVTKELRSSKGLKVDEFTNYLREVESLALDYGVNLPHPDDYNLAMGNR